MWQGLKNIYHLFVTLLANILHGFPSRKLKVIGVTGTDGKTTTVNLIYHILDQAGFKASMISTVGAIIGEKKYDVGFHVTNPSSFPLQRFIQQASKTSDYLVLEVTSHGLDQNRVFGIPFAVGVITNVTHEHLDYHKNYKNYIKAKIKLLKMAKFAIVNRDDDSYDAIVKSKWEIKNSRWITFGMGNNADVNPKKFPFKPKLLGTFNQYNCLAAIAACQVAGVSDEDIKKGIASFNPPIGRQEIVFDKDFKIMIDFAHTPNAFEEILPVVKEATEGKLIHVFGAAAKRDESKRPLMGKASAKYADIIILTAEDPRGDSVEKINKEIMSGISNFQFSIFNEKDNFQFSNKEKYLFSIPNREEAIDFAIKIAQKGDTVLLTGKGHEKSMNFGKGEEPWNEHEIVKKALMERGKEDDL